jgi:hypothetical protein
MEIKNIFVKDNKIIVLRGNNKRLTLFAFIYCKC